MLSQIPLKNSKCTLIVSAIMRVHDIRASLLSWLTYCTLSHNTVRLYRDSHWLLHALLERTGLPATICSMSWWISCFNFMNGPHNIIVSVLLLDTSLVVNVTPLSSLVSPYKYCVYALSPHTCTLNFYTSCRSTLVHRIASRQQIVALHHCSVLELSCAHNDVYDPNSLDTHGPPFIF